MRRHAGIALLAPLAAMAAGPAAADDRRASFRVAAQVVTGCTVTSEAGGSWGRIDLGTIPGIAGQSASGTLVSGGVAGLAITCTPETSASLVADAGDNPASGRRRLRQVAGSALLPYTLRIGDTATSWDAQTVPVSFPVGVSRRSLPVSATATLPAATPAGSYVDTIRVTLSF